jgi:hypothetical protein
MFICSSQQHAHIDVTCFDSIDTAVCSHTHLNLQVP